VCVCVCVCVSAWLPSLLHWLYQVQDTAAARLYV